MVTSLHRHLGETKPFHSTALFAFLALLAGGGRHHALHHFSSLDILFEQLIDLLDRGPAAAGNPLATTTVDDLMFSPFLRRHRVDDGLGSMKLLLVHLRFAQILEHPHVRQHPEDLLERTHLS